VSAAALCALTAFGCSAGTNKGEPNTFGTDTGGGGGGDDSTAGDDAFVDESGFILDSASGQGDSHIDPDAACAVATSAGERVPPNILLLFDHSGSMSTTEGGQTRWASATGAINDLLPKLPTDIRLGLKFFEAIQGDTCASATYSKPDVAIGPIASTSKSIQCWIGKATCPGITAASPSGLTPMMYGEQGAVTYMKGLALDGNKVIILITDGTPEDSCSPTSTVSGVVAAANAGKIANVTTYVIGVPGGDIAALSQVASAGGGKRTPTCVANTTDATKACHYQIGSGNVQADLLKALDDITGKSLTCVFKVPAASGDAGVDPTQVNVNLTVGGMSSTLNKDTAHMSGWDYTDGGTTITLYGAPCTTVLTDGTSKVDILLGCPTKVPQ
jgi:hypothetical protein